MNCPADTRPAALPALLSDMPQGHAKKIQVQLLLANLPLQLLNPTLRGICRWRWHQRRCECRHPDRRPPHRTQRCRPTRSKAPMPVTQQFRTHTEFSRQRRYAHPRHRRQLEPTRPASLPPPAIFPVRHTRPPPPTVCVFSASQFRGSVQIVVRGTLASFACFAVHTIAGLNARDRGRRYVSSPSARRRRSFSRS